MRRLRLTLRLHLTTNKISHRWRERAWRENVVLKSMGKLDLIGVASGWLHRLARSSSSLRSHQRESQKYEWRNEADTANDPVKPLRDSGCLIIVRVDLDASSSDARLLE